MSIDRGHPIQATWRALAAHSAGCKVCQPGVEILRRGPDDPRRMDFEVYDALCSQGQERFTAWRGAKEEWLETSRPHRERCFMLDTQLWDDGVTADLRAAALATLPDDAWRSWLALPDDRRHAQLRALERTRPPQERRLGPGDQPGSPGIGDGPRARRSVQRARPPGAPRARATLEPTE